MDVGVREFVRKALWIALGTVGAVTTLLRSVEKFIEYYVIWRVESLS